MRLEIQTETVIDRGCLSNLTGKRLNLEGKRLEGVTRSEIVEESLEVYFGKFAKRNIFNE